MKILIGICGIGNGHINRQTEVIELLYKYKHNILIATTKENISYFKERFNDIGIIKIDIPWIFCDENGIDFKNTLNKYNESKVDIFKSFLLFSSEVQSYFNGDADMVITDYEPNVAKYSYAQGIPLICMEQQSKFLYINEEKIDNYSINEERKRINYFFPKFDYKIISSFFPIKSIDNRIKIVNPIISKLKIKKNKKNHILVYFSPYESSEKYKLIIDAISKINGKKFIVYTKENYKDYYTNIVFKNYNYSFKSDLEDACCVISTAGHQLISEAISIHVPLYLIPLSTYEQHYNAKMVQRYQLGEMAVGTDSNEIKEFIEKIPLYSKNIELYKKRYYKNKWQDQLLKMINNTIDNC